MSGKMRLAAKLFLATTVLAGGSAAGAWFVMYNGWQAIAGRVADDGADGLAPEGAFDSPNSPFAAADLDAVASAWAEPAPSRPKEPADSSATARTAGALPEVDDRYSFAADSATNIEATAVDAADTAAQPSPAIDAQPAALDVDTVAAASRAAETNEVRLGSADLRASALARGQEPSEEATPRPVRYDAGDDHAELTEPQPLHATGQEQHINTAAHTSQDAPGDRTTTASGDRYSSASSTGGELDDIRSEPRSVNPLGSAPIADASAEPTRETLEPLPALPHELDERLPELAEGGDERRPSADDRTARATRGEPIDSPPTGQRAQSLDPPFPSGDRSLLNDGPARGAASEGTGRPGERALEGPQRPALEIQKFAPGEIQVGKPAKFVVQVRNVGNQAADDVTIRDEVPQGTRLVSTSPAAQSDHPTGGARGQLVWQLGKLSPGEDRTVEMQLMPTSEGEIGSVATVSYSAQASVKTRCTMPQLAIRMTAPGKVLVGQQQRVNIELRNPGSGDATGVMLFENVPQNLRHAAGPTLEFEIGTLRAGETRELELVLLAEKAGRTVNLLTARAEGNLQVQQQVEFEVVAPGLAVDIGGPERRYLERPATYEVSIENPGTAPAHDVQIVTKLPKGLRFIRANNMGEYDAATHAVYWSLAELPEGERGTVELVAMPIETGAQTLQVEGRASQGLADQAQRQIVIDGLAAIMFEVRDLEDPIEVGGETTYEIRVLNQGTKAATNVQIAAHLPPGLRLLSAEGETQHVAERGTVLFEPIPQLAPKADTLYRVRVQSTQPGDQRVTVEVVTDDLDQPIRREESTRVFGDE